MDGLGDDLECASKIEATSVALGESFRSSLQSKPVCVLYNCIQYVYIVMCIYTHTYIYMIYVFVYPPVINP